MTCAMPGGRRASQEEAFRLSFPELADASTAQLREVMAVARAAATKKRQQQRRDEAMAAWLAENQLRLQFPDGPEAPRA